MYEYKRKITENKTQPSGLKYVHTSVINFKMRYVGKVKVIIRRSMKSYRVSPLRIFLPE
jgi:hypothetical protein